MSSRPRIDIVDMKVTLNSPAGSCVLAEVEGLARRFDVTVFSEQCDAAGQPGVRHVRVPAPQAPVLLRYVVFHLLAPWYVAWWRLRRGAPACTQGTQGQLPGARISYAHFCHRAYLRSHWPQSTVSGLRRLARLANHRLNAFYEGRAFRRAEIIVVPSQGLARELAHEYPEVASKVRTLANPVNVARFARPDGFDREAGRAGLGLQADEIVMGFVALGDFARKGLGLLIDALAALDATERGGLKLLVVGGQPAEIAEYRALAQARGVGAHLVFVGLQKDVRPYLWAADVFAFPSAYEIFSLAILQAAAAGLPVLVSAGLYGAEEFVEDGCNGWVVPRDVASLAAWMRRLRASVERIGPMSALAAESVRRYSADAFVERWLALYGELVGQGDGR